MKMTTRLLIEKILLGVNLVGIVGGVLGTVVGVYLGPVIVLGCAIGAVSCVRSIRKINRTLVAPKSGGTDG